MAETKIAYAATFTVTFSSTQINQAATVKSDAQDNETPLYLDVLVEVKCSVATVASLKVVNVYALSSLDNTNYSDDDVTNGRLIGVIATPTSSEANLRGPAMSVASGFNGWMPPDWKIMIEDQSGGTISSIACIARGITSTTA